MQAHVHHSSSFEELAPEIQLELVKHMGPEDKRSWRLVNRAACQAVYASTTALSFPPFQFFMKDTLLPLPLLSKCSSLKRLSCQGLSSIHGLPPALEVLDISQTSVTDLSPLERCTGLRQLAPPAADYEGAVQQLHHILPLTALQHLDLSSYLRFRRSERYKGTRALARILMQLTGLHHLDMAWNDLCPYRAQDLAPAILQLTGLRHLGLGWNKLGAEGTRALALTNQFIKQLTWLECLNLEGNDLGAKGAQVLATAIQQLTGLKRLDLGCNGLRAKGAQALAPAIRRLTGLQHLAMGDNRLGAEGASALAPAVQQLTRLQHLDLRDNGLGAEGAHALAPAIQQLSALRRLSLQGCKVGSGGAADLAHVMKLLPGLRIFLGPEGRRLLRAAVADLPERCPIGRPYRPES